MDLKKIFSYHPSNKTDQELYRIILDYGHRIIFSKQFKEAYLQKHHVNYTVADHMLDVAIVTADKYLKGKGLNKEVLIEAALSHDLGIVGRYERYSSQYQTLKDHPANTVRVLRQQMQISDEELEKAVRSHMFPLTPLHPPKNKEGWIVMHTDNVAAVTEMLNEPIRPVIHRWVRCAVDTDDCI